jgi:hypothetical protein
MALKWAIFAKWRDGRRQEKSVASDQWEVSVGLDITGL